MSAALFLWHAIRYRRSLPHRAIVAARRLQFDHHVASRCQVASCGTEAKTCTQEAHFIPFNLLVTALGVCRLDLLLPTCDHDETRFAVGRC